MGTNQTPELLRNISMLTLLIGSLSISGCGDGDGTSAKSTASQESPGAATEDTSWFYRGGSMYKMSSLDDWRADEIYTVAPAF